MFSLQFQFSLIRFKYKEIKKERERERETQRERDPKEPFSFQLAYNYFITSVFSIFSRRAILQNRDVLSTTPWSNLLENDFWGTPLTHNGSHKSYRPLCTATFKLNYLISGFQPWSYHFVNVILHTVATFLFVSLSEIVLKTQLSILLSGLMFALHPIHCEAVAGLVGRADLLSAIFFISSLIAFHRHCKLRDKIVKKDVGRGSDNVSSSSECDESVSQFDANGNVLLCSKKLVKQKSQKSKSKQFQKENSVFTFAESFYLLVSIFFAGCAMFSKEQGITVLGVSFVIDFSRMLKQRKNLKSKSRKIKSLMTLIAATIVLLFLRARTMGYSSPSFARADNPASASDSLTTRTLTFLFLPVVNFWLVVCPSTLSFDWSMNSIELVSSFFDPRNVLTISFYFAISVIIVKTAKSILQGKVSKNVTNFTKNVEPIVTGFSKNVDLFATSFSIMILSFVPASNLFFYVGFVIAERVLYIPSIGFCLISGFSVARVIEKSREGRKMKVHCAAICLTALFILSLGLRTVRRNGDWRNEENLYRAGISINPPKGKFSY